VLWLERKLLPFIVGERFEDSPDGLRLYTLLPQILSVSRFNSLQPP